MINPVNNVKVNTQYSNNQVGTNKLVASKSSDKAEKFKKYVKKNIFYIIGGSVLAGLLYFITRGKSAKSVKGAVNKGADQGDVLNDVVDHIEMLAEFIDEII